MKRMMTACLCVACLLLMAGACAESNGRTVTITYSPRPRIIPTPAPTAAVADTPSPAPVAQEEAETIEIPVIRRRAPLELSERIAARRAAQATPTDLATGTDLEQPVAEDLTMQCVINGYTTAQHLDKMRDGKYSTYWNSQLINGAHQVTIVPPTGKRVYGVVVKWRSNPMPFAVQVENEEGEWVTVARSEAKFNEQYLAVPGVDEFRIVNADNPRVKLQICELTIIGEGALPENVHVWQEPPAEVDMMLIAGHPDDEVLWFGGLLPYYAGERQKSVLVVTAAYNIYYRKLELLDCLWTCGVRIYPHFLNYEDFVTSDVYYTINRWGSSRCYHDFTILYRRYRPLVVVLQDSKGEYGHGIHKAVSRLGQLAVGYAADPQKYPTEQEKYPVWDVPKVYVHLYAENQITMDWHQPLSRFGGMTAQDVAREAYKCHVSQQHKEYYSVQDGGPYDNELFGLFHTVVGPDVAKNDLFENLE